MTTPEPTVAHVEAVARALRQQFGEHRVDSRISAHRAMTLTDPDAQAALAANLPREVMLAALVADSWLCSQCGEMPSVMVKIGTTDGWCTNCLDEAAEEAAEEAQP